MAFWASTDTGSVPSSVRARKQRPSGGMIRWTYGLINRLVMVWDAGLLGLAGGLARVALGQDGLGLTAAQTAVAGVLGAAVYLYTLHAAGAYRLEHYLSRLRSIGDPAVGLLAGAALTWVVLWAFLPDGAAHLDGLTAWCLAAYGALVAGRLAVRAMVRRLLAAGALRRKVIVVGAGEAGARMIGRLTDPASAADYDVQAVFDDRGDSRCAPHIGGVPVKGGIEALLEHVRETPVDLIVIALPWQAAVRIHQMMGRLQTVPADTVIALDESSFRPRFAKIVSIGGLPAMQIMRQPLKGSQQLVKTAEDYIVAGLGLLFASPFLLLIALAVRLDSPGRALFRQPRVGFNNQVFEIYKFRTMTVDPLDDGSKGTSAEDPRITRVGRILRRTSLDELPQLINVLRGEMSVVGPRAHVPNMLVTDQPYYEAVREYAARCRIKPGITGWAQINGMRGGIHTVDKAKRGVDLDLHYIENWSLWLDVKIMIRTLSTGMFGRNVF